MTPQRIIERLEEIEDWQLTPQQWDTVGDVLKSLGAVLAEGDDTGTVHVLARLEPLERAGAARRARARLGADRTPIPPQQREQRNHLIERLTVDLRGPQDPPRGEGDGGETAG
ncbi:CATRA system-associated protein [Streptomyces sp. NPDC101213]|uniref:CATRA system-associated protein n=1 Tax=unclassified Streptomyces TaxID=2593676 RepID=UPI0036F7920D